MQENTTPKPILKKLTIYMGFLWAFITSLVIFVPFLPNMPSFGLDASWMFGINQAVAQKLAFGQDMIFTFGPYTAVYTQLYHPATDAMMMWTSFYLAVVFFLLSMAVGYGKRWYWLVPFFAIWLMFVYAQRDPLLFTMPLLLGLFVYKNYSEDMPHWLSKKYFLYVLWFSLPILAVLPMIKGVMLVMSIVFLMLFVVFLIIKRELLNALIGFFIPMLSMPILWMVSGQEISVMGSYFHNMLPIISGYSDAMSLFGRSFDIFSYVGTATFILISIFYLAGKNNNKVFLFCLFGAFLFLVFKSAFIRHDAHSLIASIYILSVSVLWVFINNNRLSYISVILAIVCWYTISEQYDPIKLNAVPLRIAQQYQNAWSGIGIRISHPEMLKKEYDESLRLMHQYTLIEPLSGTTDIYADQQSILLASNNNWSPRPIFQSYAAYNSMLAEVNNQHLLGKKAPNNILFRLETIDGRLPSLDDGASWQTLLSKYEPTKLEGYFLYLKDKGKVQPVSEEKIAVTSRKLNQWVDVPNSNSLIFAQINLKPTLLGRINNFLFKNGPVYILLKCQDGHIEKYRFIAAMGEPSFLMSPLVQTTEDFSWLYSDLKFLENKKVVAFALVTDNPLSLTWQYTYQVGFKRVHLKEMNTMANIYPINKTNDLVSSKVTLTEKCQGFIEDIYPKPYKDDKYYFTSVFSMKGWLADKEAAVEGKYAVLTDVQGKHYYTHLENALRPDVVEYFKANNLLNAGYQSYLDVAGLHGDYRLSLAFKRGDAMVLCEAALPVHIE